MKSIDTAKIAIWDWPTRLFHWLLAALIGFSWWSAKNDHIDWHMWSGFGILTLLLFRILWGLFGSSTARFSSFVRGPRSVISYLRDSKGWRDVGHTPLGALSVVAILAMIAVQLTSGLFQTDDDGLHEGPLAPLVSFDVSDAAHEVHEISFNILLGLIGLHIAAILYYRIIEKKRLIEPMISGRGEAADGALPMRPGKWWVALLCLLGAFAFTRWIVAGAPPFG